jgi:hypothetical protein
MKKINRIFVFLLSMAAMLSCEEKFQTFESGDYFVRFQGGVQTIVEGEQSIKIPISLGAPAQSQAVEIAYEISGSAVEGEDFEFESTKGVLSIPAGSFADTVRIDILDDLATDGAKDLILTLTSVSGGLSAGVGTFGKSYKVSIADNDCAFDISGFVGTYTIEITSEAAFGNPAGLYVSETTLSLGTEPNTLVDANFWDFGGSVVITLNGPNLTTELIGTQQAYLNASGLPRFAIQGTQPIGSITTCDNGLVVNMELTRQDGVTVANRSVIRYIKN